MRVLDSAGAQVGALRPAGATATSLVVTGLTNGSSYRFQVAATNTVGTGPNSALSTVVIPATVPGAPVIATAASGTRRRNGHRHRPLEHSDQQRRISGDRVRGSRAADVDNRHRPRDHDLGSPAGFGPAADDDVADR